MKDDTTISDGSSPGDEGEELYKRWRKQKQEFGEERYKLYSAGLLDHSLVELIALWPRELDSLGLTEGKDRSPSDVPQEAGAVPVKASDGREVWIRPAACRDEDGDPVAEVRERYSRTTGAILAMLAVVEGGEGTVRKGMLDTARLRDDYAAWRPTRAADEPVNPPNERLLDCADALARHYRPDLDALSEPERREVVIDFAQRIHGVAKATRELQEFAEKGGVGHTGDPARDVRAAELRRKGWSTKRIGLYLRIPETKTDQDRYENQNARNAADRGDQLLDQATE